MEIVSYVGIGVMLLVGVFFVKGLFAKIKEGRENAPDAADANTATTAKAAPAPVKSQPQSTDLVGDLQSIILGLDPEKDAEKIDFLLKQVAPTLVDPRGK